MQSYILHPIRLSEFRGPSLSDITDRNAIIQAIEEHDEVGREAFLAKYGYKKARTYYLKVENNYYDSKAIVGVAHRYIAENGQPLKSSEFSGGEAAAVKVLKKFGFEIVRESLPTPVLSKFPLRAYSWVVESNNTFIKSVDKSCFLHHGTGIPFILRQYLNIENVSPTNSVRVTLSHDGIDHRAYFEMTALDRTRLMWYADFSAVLKNAFPQWFDAFIADVLFIGDSPQIIFTKRNESSTIFDVRFIDKPLRLRDATGNETERREWSDEENNLIVADYISMLEKELQGEGYSKTEHRDVLLGQLYNRSKGSVEFKHQNISAALAKMGLPYLQGYKPRFNIQSSLSTAVEAYLQRSDSFNVLLLAHAQRTPAAPTTHFDVSIAQVPPPEISEQSADTLPMRSFRGRKVDYTRRESENRSLGLKGEEFVVAFEKQRMIKVGRIDLVEKVRHASQVDGDGLGYDILSFTANGEPLYIEVKTTRTGKYTPFFMSAAEKDFLEQNADHYRLYRVFDFDNKRQLYILTGTELLACRFDANQYTVSL